MKFETGITGYFESHKLSTDKFKTLTCPPPRPFTAKPREFELFDSCFLTVHDMKTKFIGSPVEWIDIPDISGIPVFV